MRVRPWHVSRLGNVAYRNCGAIPAHTIFIDVHTKARSLEDIYMAAGSWNWRG